MNALKAGFVLQAGFHYLLFVGRFMRNECNSVQSKRGFESIIVEANFNFCLLIMTSIKQ
jgi:hypothetical protein